MITEPVLQNTPQRTIKGKVELYKGSTLAATFNYDDNLISAEVSRQGVGKFFGYGISQKLTVVLLDKTRSFTGALGDTMLLYFNGNDTGYINNFPVFEIAEIKRDENNNNLTITAYDALHKAKEVFDKGTVALPATLGDYIEAGANALGIFFDNTGGLEYADGANLEGTETIREVLDAAAEATQSFYYIDMNNELIFKQSRMDDESVYTIDKSQYFTLVETGYKQLGAICSATELGDNLISSYNIEGTETQYVRDNPFWTLREDLPSLLDQALSEVGGLQLCQFTCVWRGNYLLEPGDRIDIVTKNGGTIGSYFINDTIKYNGGFTQTTSWEYTAGAETAANSSSLGEVIKQTYARVDKANKTIDLVVSESNAIAANMSALQLNTDSISASVSSLSESTKTALSGVSEEVNTIKNQVAATMTEKDVTLLIENTISDGVNQVTTVEKKFTFNDDGLRIAKDNSQMETVITEDGMRVYKDGEEALAADNEGVKAIDLHATTFLIIGDYSRLENYNGRTACFWLGG